MTVKLQRPSTERSRYTIHSPGFPSILSLANLMNPPHLPVVPKTRFLSSHRHLEKELEVTRGAECHVEYIAVQLALGRQHALEVVHRKGNLGPSRGKRVRRGCSSPMRVCRLEEGAPFLFLI